MSSRLYSTDLAFIHHVGHGEFARRVAPEIIRILRANGIARGLIVEAGCGSGILAAQLVAAGYNVLGIDQSAAMIRLARATAPAARFRVASLAHASIPPCRAIIAAGEVITYVGRREASAFIRRAGARLEPGAHRTYALRTRVGDGWSLTSRASLNASARLLTRHIATARQIRGTLRRLRETHRVRIYRRSEIAAVLATAGFEFTMRRRFGRCPLLPGNVAVIARKLRTPGRTL